MAKKLKVKSLLELTFVADGQLSPDGRRAVAVHTTIEQGEDNDKPPRYVSHLFLYDTGAGEAVQLTRSGEGNTRPRFSPDGSQLAFLSKREGEEKPQLFLLPLSGGEARRLTSLKAGVSEFAWHPSGRSLALASRGDWEDEAGKKGHARTIERMFYKGDGVGFKPTEPAQIYLCDVHTGDSEKLSKLKSDPSGLVWSPDGEVLYFTAAEDEAAADDWRSNVWALPREGGKARALVTNLSRAASPSPSPDGAHLALLSPTDGENFASPTGLWVLSSEGGEARLLTDDLEAIPAISSDSHYGGLPNTPQWAEDGGAVFINANREGRSGVARVGLDGEVRAFQKGDRAVTGFHHAAGRFVFTAETPSEPGELFFRDGRGKEMKLSAANASFVAKYRLAEASGVGRAKARGGPRLAYWTLTPHKPRKDKAMVLQVHGGPHTNYGYGFLFEFQLLAAAGYTVVYGNPRGSSSYGADFTLTMQGGYGTIDADDVMAIAHAARKDHPDPEAPVHLTGGSYGGFMTNWLVTRTDAFRSAVTQRSICNWLSFYGTSDIGYNFAEQEVAGNPWEHTERLWDQSPLKYVANVTTPLLILHAEEDHRCPVEQAEQLFIALKKLRKETRLIRFPGEGHELSRSGRPDRRMARLEAILGWFEAHP